MLTKFPIIMLPTNNATKLTLQDGVGLYLSDITEAGNSAWKNQHLYVLSNEQPKLGDWVIVNGIPKQISSIQNIEGWTTIRCNNSNSKDNLHSINQAKKIIATDNEDLEFVPHISKLPLSLINAFINAYNEKNPLTEVELETSQSCSHSGTHCKTNDAIFNGCGNCNILLKINSHNTVIYHENNTTKSL